MHAHLVTPVRFAAAFLALSVSVGVATPVAHADLPPRPEAIQFAPLAFTPPSAKDYRHVLKNGTVVYLAPNHEFPLVNLTMTFKGGAFLDPADAPGLSAITAALMRSGGTESLAPAEFDERLDFLATRAGVQAGDTAVSASLNTLSKNFDESFGLFMDMLRRPRFDQARLDVQKGEVVERLKQRNDRADAILGREWASLLYGADHFSSRQPTKASIDGIDAVKLRAMHDRVFHPGNVIVAVSGDFEPQAMLATLEQAFAGWPAGETIPDPPAPTAELKPGLYHVQKDIPQGKVVIGLRSIRRDDPDFFPMLVANEILGGGGFTSRIMTSVRSNEGLAYSAGTSFDPEVWYPGDFTASFESKSPTVALAIKLIDEEFGRIRSEPVSAQELETAKSSFVETFPQNFASKDAMLRIFVSDEWTKRPEGYWQSFRESVMKVTPEDIQRVARERLDPSKMAIMVVGDWDPIYAGNERASMKDFFKGDVQHIPLKDPLTLEPIR
jgi:zinc protease